MTSTESGIGGELIYEYTLQLTQVTDYGVSLDQLQAGTTAPPAEGVRLDVAFEGRVTGPKLSGAIKGVDYIHIRADGRAQLHIHAEITTEGGQKIALAADGVAMLQAGAAVNQLRENATLTTSAAEYTWVNPLDSWQSGRWTWRRAKCE